MGSDLTRVRERLDLDSPDSGPKGTAGLRSEREPLAPPRAQLAVLEELDLEGGDFERVLEAAGWAGLRRGALEILQINIGRLCNMSCRHCHVDAGPDRVVENMDRGTVDACLAVLDATDVHTVDITGGAPELNPSFRYLVEGSVARGKHVIDRSNLTVLLLKAYRGLPEWLGERGVEIVASLPHYRRPQTDAQRGNGAHERSIRALRLLNEAGYGRGDPERVLTLMHNPAGAFLPAGVASMERTWREKLERQHGVTFDRLIALNNMPIARFLEWLLESGNLSPYMRKLVETFNPGSIPGLMCRNTLSVSWDGTLYDCDFNQMLELPIRSSNGRPGGAMNIRDLDPAALADRRVVTARHCFGCTAGAGSGCGGQIV